MTAIEQERTGLMSTPVPEPGPAIDPIERPAPHRWIWYALGARLPERNRGWVLHDTTTRTWWLRHLARMLVQLAVPIAVIGSLLPAPWQLRVAAALGGVLLALIFSLAYMSETTENRVVKAGYPAGTAQASRDRDSLLRQQKESERKRTAAARRAARYQGRIGH